MKMLCFELRDIVRDIKRLYSYDICLLHTEMVVLMLVMDIRLLEMHSQHSEVEWIGSTSGHPMRWHVAKRATEMTGFGPKLPEQEYSPFPSQ